MLSMQPQARPPARFSHLSPAAFFEDSTATFETRNLYSAATFPMLLAPSECASGER